MATVVIIDYGLGNVRSVRGAVERLGHEAVVSAAPKDLRAADALILPGVGAFGDGMKKLHERNLIEPLNQYVLGDRKPILGICLGAQLMTKSSSEFGQHEGLKWIDASVERLPANGLPLPHVGWNDLEIVKNSQLFRDMSAQPLVYYVHSFHIRCHNESLVTAQCDYGVKFTASYECGNIFGSQFHPEKSQAEGLVFLSNFLNFATTS